LSNDKDYLRECFSGIANYLKEDLLLTIHPKSGIFQSIVMGLISWDIGSLETILY